MAIISRCMKYCFCTNFHESTLVPVHFRITRRRTLPHHTWLSFFKLGGLHSKWTIWPIELLYRWKRVKSRRITVTSKIWKQYFYFVYFKLYLYFVYFRLSLYFVYFKLYLHFVYFRLYLYFVYFKLYIYFVYFKLYLYFVYFKV